LEKYQPAIMERKGKIMSNSRKRKLILGLSTGLAIMYSPAHAASTSISIAASPTVALVLVDVIGAFQGYYYAKGFNYEVAVTGDTTANLQAEIASGGTASPYDLYDLFLTEDHQATRYLEVNYRKYLEDEPFYFADDFVDLYSASVDIHNGLPYHLTTPIVIADPTTEVYGKAAAEILASAPWSITTIPSTNVVVEPSVGITQVAIELGAFSYGFVNKSAICNNYSGTETYPAGTFHHEYLPDGRHPYHRIELTGVKLTLAPRTAEQETELTNFVDFLTGRGTTLGTDVLKRYCYNPSND
jgi:molybdate transport system substrate-binding protein